MSHRVARMILCVGLLAMPTVTAAAGPSMAELANTVKTGAPDARKQAVATMIELLQSDPDQALPKARAEWADALKGARMPRETAELMVATIAAAERTAASRTPAQDAFLFTDLWNRRINALVDARKAKEAGEALQQATNYKVGDRTISPSIGVFVRVAEALRNAQLHEEAERTALSGLHQRTPDVLAVVGLQRVRALSLLDGGKPEAALSAARGFYNVCLLRESAEAIELLSRCLVAARPDEAGIAKRFKTQQVLLATAPSTPDAKPEAAVAPNVLETIPTEAALFDESIALLNAPTDFAGCMAKGNLLLLADQGPAGRKCFEQAMDLAKDDGQLTVAIEGVARAIRTAERGVGGANQYILSLQAAAK